MQRVTYTESHTQTHTHIQRDTRIHTYTHGSKGCTHRHRYIRGMHRQTHTHRDTHTQTHTQSDTYTLTDTHTHLHSTVLFRDPQVSPSVVPSLLTGPLNHTTGSVSPFLLTSRFCITLKLHACFGCPQGYRRKLWDSWPSPYLRLGNLLDSESCIS